MRDLGGGDLGEGGFGGGDLGGGGWTAPIGELELRLGDNLMTLFKYLNKL